MSTTHWTLPPTKDLNAARREYVEQFGSLVVMNTYLKITILVLAGITLMLPNQEALARGGGGFGLRFARHPVPISSPAIVSDGSRCS